MIAILTAKKPTNATSKRYCIEYSIHEVDDQGDTVHEEVVGCTLDYTTTDLEALTADMYEQCQHLDESMFWNMDGEMQVTPRRPIEQGEWPDA